MIVQRGELWWADLRLPRGSEPALRRPVLVLQADAFNRSRLATVVVASLTSQLKYATAPGNVTCRPRGTGLPSVSVINVSQITTIDKRFLGARIGQLPRHLMSDVEEGLKLVLGL